jgi:uncharacterized membrane protein YuzA (DUF378 family)
MSRTKEAVWPSCEVRAVERPRLLRQFGKSEGVQEMKAIDFLSVILVVVGAMNWGLVGVFQFNLVTALFGDATILSRLVYTLVGAAGLFQALQWKAIQGRWIGATTLPAAANTEVV